MIQEIVQMMRNRNELFRTHFCQVLERTKFYRNSGCDTTVQTSQTNFVVSLGSVRKGCKTLGSQFVNVVSLGVCGRDKH